MEVTLENVRSFCGEHRLPLRPLTLLVGENSTGKTTFMAMVANVLQFGFPSTRPTFSLPPFDLGTYESIATYKSGKYGRASSFSLGVNEESGKEARRVRATYANHKGQPQLTELLAAGEGGEIELKLSQELRSVRLQAKPRNEAAVELEIDLTATLPGIPDVPVGLMVQAALHEAGRKGDPGSTQPDFARLARLASLVTPRPRPVFALAPVRTKPKRTYDEFSDEYDPEGDHVPVLLARLPDEEEGPRKQRLLRALNEFGKSASLFTDIRVRKLGKHPSDPFQILVSTGGAPANLPDVGYGISQALPVVVQSVMANERAILLLQQPEVHLHPRGQAALGSFFARVVAEEKKQMVVETHSDYLVDRVRQEVARGTISKDDVALLFFEKPRHETTTHLIELDSGGNVLGAPSSYREFFVGEEIGLLTRAK